MEGDSVSHHELGSSAAPPFANMVPPPRVLPGAGVHDARDVCARPPCAACSAAGPVGPTGPTGPTGAAFEASAKERGSELDAGTASGPELGAADGVRGGALASVIAPYAPERRRARPVSCGAAGLGPRGMAGTARAPMAVPAALVRALVLSTLPAAGAGRSVGAVARRGVRGLVPELPRGRARLPAPAAPARAAVGQRTALFAAGTASFLKTRTTSLPARRGRASRTS